MNRLAKGQKVVVSGAAGTVHGEVVDILTPDRPLPEVGGGIDPAEARQCMIDLGIAQFATILYVNNFGQALAFVAAGDGAGKWRDLKQQDLTITPHGVEN